ncbi:MAG: hypothetical protein AB7E13_04795 [Arcobacteraceae bacterium]
MTNLENLVSNSLYELQILQEDLVTESSSARVEKLQSLIRIKTNELKKAYKMLDDNKVRFGILKPSNENSIIEHENQTKMNFTN